MAIGTDDSVSERRRAVTMISSLSGLAVGGASAAEAAEGRAPSATDESRKAQIGRKLLRAVSAMVLSSRGDLGAPAS
jgi:hypothetical protein